MEKINVKITLEMMGMMLEPIAGSRGVGNLVIVAIQGHDALQGILFHLLISRYTNPSGQHVQIARPISLATEIQRG